MLNQTLKKIVCCIWFIKLVFSENTDPHNWLEDCFSSMCIYMWLLNWSYVKMLIYTPKKFLCVFTWHFKELGENTEPDNWQDSFWLFKLKTLANTNLHTWHEIVFLLYLFLCNIARDLYENAVPHSWQWFLSCVYL